MATILPDVVPLIFAQRTPAVASNDSYGLIVHPFTNGQEMQAPEDSLQVVIVASRLAVQSAIVSTFFLALWFAISPVFVAAAMLAALEMILLQDEGFVPSTQSHIKRVHALLLEIRAELANRGSAHDASKLEEPEHALFEQAYADLSKVEYGSDEYRMSLARARNALDHHYAHNRHHPEHFSNGVDDMTLIDLVEMLADWKAASERRPDAEIHAGIRINAERFKLSPQLTNIFLNTAWEWWGGSDGAQVHLPDEVRPGQSTPGDRDLFVAACDRLWGAYQASLEGRTLEEIAGEIGLDPTLLEHVVLAVATMIAAERKLEGPPADADR